MKKENGLKFIFSFAKDYRLELLLAFFCSLVYVSTYIAVPLFSGQALDYIKAGDGKSATLDIILIASLTLGGGVFYYLMSFFSSDVAYKMARDMRKQAMDKILKAKLAFLDKKAHGDIISTLIGDVDIISDGLVETFLEFFTGLFTIIGTLVMMMIVCYPLGLTVILLTPLSMIAAYFIAKGTKKTFKKQSDLRGKLNALSVETISNGKNVMAYNYQEEAKKEFLSRSKALEEYDFKTEFLSAFINPMTRMLNAIIYGAVATVGAIFIVKGQFSMSAGDLMTFLMFTNNYTQPFNAISNVISDLQNCFASASRLNELLKIPQIEIQPGEEKMEQADGSLSFQNVSFSYDPARPLLRDIDVSIKPGMHVALVGSTGCGKTTLINLLMRFYDPDGGKIILSGKDTKYLSRESIRNIFGMVLQDTWVFRGTIKENIAYGAENPSEEEIEAAAKKANADFFIKQMKDGYDNFLNSAEALSEGQKQLICIARLMLKKPKMLILDEATSNIDTRSELLIQKAFDQMMENKTSLVIAHRLSTIVNADLILVMKDGKIIERGTHGELITHGGFYKELYESQFAKA
ncbi:MAG: ABC transporter ATP-binding protein/permease [Bacilli bacterium]|jgi:ATP-binding cassette subfamily B protein|nr:ABC transporter ATP-binding protein/permease [Bacilli bacterium]